MSDHLHPTRLLLAIVREDDAAIRRELAVGSVDSAAFVACCIEADVHAWVHARLVAGGHAEALGRESMDALATRRAKLRRDNLLLLGRAERALDALHEAGVVPIALKGLDFLHRLYESADLRQTDDVDLLVKRADLPRALDALCAAGWTLPDEPAATHYIRSSHHLPLRSPGPLPVEFELHWNLAQDERYHIDVEALFRAARPLDVAGREILRLDDRDVVAHLLVHHVSHYFDRRLKWLVDLRRIEAASPIDWDAVAARIGEWGATAAAAAAVLHLQRLDPRTVSFPARRALPLAAWRRLALLPLRSSHPLELFRGTRRRSVQLYLAAALLERPSRLPAWLIHRRRRDTSDSEHPLERRPNVPDAGARKAR